MINRFVSRFNKLFAATSSPRNRRPQRSGFVWVEQLEIRRMLTTPAIAAPTTISVSENGSIGFTAGNSISVSDTNGSTESYSIVAQHGTLTFGSVTGLTVSGNGTGTVLVSGNVSALNTGLLTLVYAPTSNFTGQDTVGMYVQNTGNNQAASAAINVTVTNTVTGPTIAAPASVNILQDASFAFTSSNAISANDTNGASEEYSVVAQHGTLAFGSATGLTVYGNGTGTVVATGTLAALNAALATLAYTPTTSFTGQDSIVMDVQNLGNNQATMATVGIVVNSNSVPPVLISPSSTPQGLSVTEGGGLLLSGNSQFGISDTPGANEVFSAVAQHGTFTVGTVAGATIYGDGEGTIVIIAPYQAMNQALSQMVYTPNANFVGQDSVVMDVQNATNNLAAGIGFNITVTAASTPPSIAAPTSINVDQNGGYAFLPVNTITVTDIFGATDQFQITAQHGILSIFSSDGVTVTGNASGTLTLTGHTDKVNAALATLVYLPSAGYTGTDTLSMSSTNQGNSLSASGTVTANVTGANNIPPSLYLPFTAQGAFTGVPTGFQVIANDNTQVTTYFSIVAPHGTLTLGPQFGVDVFGSGTGTIVISGPLLTLNKALQSLTYTSPAGFVGTETLTMDVVNSSNNLAASATIDMLVHHQVI